MNALGTAAAAPASPPHPPHRHASPAPAITPHLALVTTLARRIARQRRLDLCSLEIDDLISIGTAALIEAARRFDPTRGARFATFAYHRVNGAMLDALRSTGCYRQRHRPSRACEPGESVLVVSLEAHATACDAIADEGDLPDSTAAARATAQRLRDAISRLPATERRLVEGYYFEERSLDRMGAELGTSRSWTCRLLHRAIANLKRSLIEDRSSAVLP